MVAPRSRANRLRRDIKKIHMDQYLRESVGGDWMKQTCPRCGWECTYLVRPYYDSPWREFGGICPACVRDANSAFERDGWPPDPADVTQPIETYEKLKLDLD